MMRPTPSNAWKLAAALELIGDKVSWDREAQRNEVWCERP